MDRINTIFSSYDKFIMGITPSYSGIISLAIFLLLLWALFRFVKGNFIWILLIIFLIPAAWPALKSIARVVFLIGEFLILRIKLH